MHKTGFLLVVFALAIAGCGGGGDSKKSSASSSGGGAQQVRDDANAKGNARMAITELESCYVDQMDYAPCAKSVATPGVTATGTATGYTVTSVSKSGGGSFVITKADGGSLNRTCTLAGKGGCSAAGAW
jgi:type IV pilus assembly protein PilA